MNDKFFDSKVFYRSKLAELPMIALLLIIIILKLYLTAKYNFGLVNYNLSLLGKTYTLSFSLLSILTVFVFLLILRNHYNQKLIVGSNFVICKSGIISINQQDVRLDFENIRGIEIDKSILDRILNLGKLKIGSSSTDQIEIIFSGLRNPNQVRALIEYRIHKSS